MYLGGVLDAVYGLGHRLVDQRRVRRRLACIVNPSVSNGTAERHNEPWSSANEPPTSPASATYMSLTTDLERTATAVTMPNSSSTSRPLMWSPVQHDDALQQPVRPPPHGEYSSHARVVKYTGSTRSAAARVASSRRDRAAAWDAAGPRDKRQETRDSIRKRKGVYVRGEGGGAGGQGGQEARHLVAIGHLVDCHDLHQGVMTNCDPQKWTRCTHSHL